jgi:MFS transporter, FHS family, glucose/mannose:H+ symporter
VLLGPLLPILSARWSLSDTEAGYLVSAQFLGSLLSTLSSSIVLPRFGFRWSIAIGLFLMAFGTAMLSVHTFLWGIVAVSCYGAGTGLTVPAGNLLVASATPEHRSASLSVLNFCWSAGAVACPFLLAAFQREHRTDMLLGGVAAALVLLVATLFAVPINLPDASTPGPSPSKFSRLEYLRTHAAIVLAILFFFYVGTESAVGIWLASYAGRISGTRSAEWITAPSYFYGALLLGRIIAPPILKRVSDTRYARFSALLAVLSVGALLGFRSFLSIAICAAFAGFGLSALYPIMIGFLSASFGAAASRIAGTIFAFSTLGAASIPWLVGYLSTEYGSLRIAMVITLAGALIMLCMFCINVPLGVETDP